MEGKQEIGRVTHFYPKISVALIELETSLAVGDKISIVGKMTNLEQVVDSIQIEHKDVKRAGPGQSIGLRVVSRVRETDTVYK